MPDKKGWNQEQDKILKFLRQERKQPKWSNIARILQSQFDIKGKTGKQCRERYHNHLDSMINTQTWSPEEEHCLYELHEQYGNKWSLISKKLSGRQNIKSITFRSDNCVKNHYYSKLRKAIRKLNKIAVETQIKQYNQIKNQILYKILETAESKFKVSSKVDQELEQFCSDLKNRLFLLNTQDNLSSAAQILEAQHLYNDIRAFSKDTKKLKKIQRHFSLQPGEDNFLHPKSCLKIKKAYSNNCSSDQDSCSASDSQFLSSVSGSNSDYGQSSSTSFYKSDISDQVKIEEQLPSTNLRDSQTTKKTNHSLTIRKTGYLAVNNDSQLYSPQIRSNSKLLLLNHQPNVSNGFLAPINNQVKVQAKSQTNYYQFDSEQKEVYQQDVKVQQDQSHPNYNMEQEQYHEQYHQDFLDLEKSPKCAFFQDIKIEMRIISPKVSDSSDKDFSKDDYCYFNA